VALSIRQAQQNYLKTVHLDQIGSSKDIKGVKLDAIESAMIEFATMFKVLADKKLSVQDAINTGKLADSIQFNAVEYLGGIYSVEIRVLDYYRWIDKGVKGVRGGGNSPYSFKNTFVSKKMMQEIRKWLIREGLKARTRETIRKPLGQERKGRRFANTDKTTSFAYAVARSIKIKGIKPTNFWSDTEVEVRKQMHQELGNYFNIAIINALTS
jgi:hypothetical protein